MDDVVLEREALGHGGVHQDVIERLRVAVEDERLAVVLGDRLRQIREHAALHRLERVREVEVVEVPEHDDEGIRIDRHDLLDEVVHRPNSGSSPVLDFRWFAMTCVCPASVMCWRNLPVSTSWKGKGAGSTGGPVKPGTTARA